MWPEGEEPQRYDWEVGTLIVPPNMWFHQHFNTGTTPARYLAFKHEVVSIRNAQGVPKAWISRRVGGDQIDYADETPLVRKMFSDELAKHGLTPRMDQAYAQELADLPPLAKAAGSRSPDGAQRNPGATVPTHRSGSDVANQSRISLRSIRATGGRRCRD